MAEIVKVNSKKGLVSLTQKDIAENDLAPWIRTNSKGFGHYSFVNQQPFERVAAKLFVDKYPSTHVKLAENIVCTKEGGVDVFLRITDDQSRGYYNTHPTKLVFNKGKQMTIEDITKHGSEDLVLELEEDEDSEEGSEEDTDFYGEIEEFLNDVKSLSEDDLVKKISPDELEEISKMLDLDSESKEDSDDEDIDIEIELEDEDEGDEEEYEYEDEEDIEEDSEDEFEDEDEDDGILKEVNLEDFSEEKGPEIIEIEGKLPMGKEVDKVPSDEILRNIIKEVLG